MFRFCRLLTQKRFIQTSLLRKPFAMAQFCAIGTFSMSNKTTYDAYTKRKESAKTLLDKLITFERENDIRDFYDFHSLVKNLDEYIVKKEYKNSGSIFIFGDLSQGMTDFLRDAGYKFEVRAWRNEVTTTIYLS